MPTFLIEVIKGEYTAHSFEDECADDAEAFHHAARLASQLEESAQDDILHDCAIVIRDGSGKVIGQLPLGADIASPPVVPGTAA